MKNWRVKLTKTPVRNDFAHDFFPRYFHYKKEAEGLVQEVKDKGGVAELEKVAADKPKFQPIEAAFRVIGGEWRTKTFYTEASWNRWVKNSIGKYAETRTRHLEPPIDVCKSCGKRLTDAEIQLYRTNANGADDNGFPRFCEDCPDAT